MRSLMQYSNELNKSCSSAEHPKDIPFPSNLASSIYSHIFHSYCQAANQGFLSKSQWLKRNRQPLTDAPKAIVVRKTAVSVGLANDLVLEHLHDDLYSVIMDYFEVIHKDHTVPVAKASPINVVGQETLLVNEGQKSSLVNDNKVVKESVSSLSPISVFSSIDRREESENEVSALKPRRSQRY